MLYSFVLRPAEAASLWELIERMKGTVFCIPKTQISFCLCPCGIFEYVMVCLLQPLGGIRSRRLGEESWRVKAEEIGTGNVGASVVGICEGAPGRYVTKRLVA